MLPPKDGAVDATLRIGEVVLMLLAPVAWPWHWRRRA